MPLDDNDKEWVKSWVREYTKPRFVSKDDCDEKTGVIDGKLNEDYADKRLVMGQLKLIIAVLGAIGVGVLGLVLNQLWGVA